MPKSLLGLLIILIWAALARGEPVQYCRHASPDRQGKDIDFCVGALMWHNASTDAHDLFVTMAVKRYDSSALGWTATGPGTVMDGALMFILYGDPSSGDVPLLSIRTANGHHQPTLLTQGDMYGGLDLRVISSRWFADETNPSMVTGRVSLVCYSCHLWQGTNILADATSQPWLWAWNAEQDFDNDFTFDAHLKMHRHHAGAGGWGNYYFNIKQSVSNAQYPPSLPPIRPDVLQLGASDTPGTLSGAFAAAVTSSASYIHGALLGITFLLLLPGGVIGLRLGFAKSFTYHWIAQLCGSLLFFIGMTFGVLKSRKIDSLHQWIGIGIATVIGFQGLLGWWHHRMFLRLHRQTWCSHVHIWLGRAVLVAGAVNVVLGLLLRGYGPYSPTMIGITVLLIAEMLTLPTWLWWLSRRNRKRSTPAPAWANGDEHAYTLTGSDEDEDEKESREDDDSTTLLADEKTGAAK